MEYQADDGHGIMSGYPVPTMGSLEADLYTTDTRVEETPGRLAATNDAAVSTRDKPGCEGCEHWQQQFAAAIQNYNETQAALQSDLINLAEQQIRMVNAFNVIGSQQQQMWDGIGNLMRFMNSIASDLSTMSVMDKVKLARQLMGDKD